MIDTSNFRIVYDSVDEIRDMLEDIGYQELTKPKAETLKKDDVIKIFIISKETTEVYFFLTSVVTHFSSSKGELYLLDKREHITPDMYDKNSKMMDGEEWNISTDSIGKDTSHLFYYSYLGTAEDNPEYFL
jgi:hypothetical protein